MWRYKKIFSLAAVVVVLVLFVVLRPKPASLGKDVATDLDSGQVRGKRDAQKDLDSGHYIQLGYGLPLPWHSEFEHCLGNYGIEVRNVGGDVYESGRDVSTGTEMSHYESYNATRSAAIKQKFGSDVFEKCMDAARKSWESNRPKSPQK